MSELDARLAEPDRAWRARLHPNWVNPPDPLPVLVEAEDLASKPPTPFIALHALLVHAANDDVTSLRTVCSVVPDLSEVQAGTLGEVAEGLAALLEGDARLALDHLLEALPGLSALGGSRGQQEVVLETAFAAMMRLGSAGTGRPAASPISSGSRRRRYPGRGELTLCGAQSARSRPGRAQGQVFAKRGAPGTRWGRRPGVLERRDQQANTGRYSTSKSKRSP